VSGGDAEGAAREHPYVPEPGDVVLDAVTRRIGRVMDTLGARLQLRALNGGREWDAEPADVVPAAQSDALSAAVAEVNARSRSRLRERSWTVAEG
jgi:hypothetical protein